MKHGERRAVLALCSGEEREKVVSICTFFCKRFAVGDFVAQSEKTTMILQPCTASFAREAISLQ
jgi:hypothetical protein